MKYKCDKCGEEVGTVYDTRMYDRDVEICTACAIEKGIL